MLKFEATALRPLAVACLAIALAIVTPSVSAEPPVVGKTIAGMSPLERSLIETEVSNKINGVLRGLDFLDGQNGPIEVTSLLDAETGELLVDMGEAYGPQATSLAMEDLHRGITEVAAGVLGETGDWTGVALRFGGKDMYYWFPEERPREPSGRPKRSAALGYNWPPAPILLSAGHGAYYHKGWKAWTSQRDKSPYGVLEDSITQDFVEELDKALALNFLGERRPDTPTFLTRSLSSELHEASGRTWRELGARYHLKELYPGNPEIWNSKPKSTDADSERIEDIYSRPLVANHIKAAAAIHIHTNAWTPEARGARFYYQAGNAEGKRLASALACHVRELVHSKTEFADYVVEANARSANYAELRAAEVPSALVEIGYHTNQKDSETMLDPEFRKVAMAGVRKGYQHFKADRGGCDPFKVSDIAYVSTFSGGVDIDVTFSGEPTWPMEVRLTDDEGTQTFTELHWADIKGDRMRLIGECTWRGPQQNYKIEILDRDQIKFDGSIVADCWSTAYRE
ncbi:MAG: N-acetylmuramoyl-L-alanine amidase [Luteibacter sp.]